MIIRIASALNQMIEINKNGTVINIPCWLIVFLGMLVVFIISFVILAITSNIAKIIKLIWDYIQLKYEIIRLYIDSIANRYINSQENNKGYRKVESDFKKMACETLPENNLVTTTKNIHSTIKNIKIR